MATITEKFKITGSIIADSVMYEIMRRRKAGDDILWDGAAVKYVDLEKDELRLAGRDGKVVKIAAMGAAAESAIQAIRTFEHSLSIEIGGLEEHRKRMAQARDKVQKIHRKGA